MELIKPHLPALFEPIQLGVGAPGGSERAVHDIQAALDQSKESILLKCDLKNAFNEVRKFYLNVFVMKTCDLSGVLLTGLIVLLVW